MKSHHELTLETLKGCGKEFEGFHLLHTCGTEILHYGKTTGKFELCPICKAKAQTLLDAGKWFLEELNKREKALEEYMVSNDYISDDGTYKSPYTFVIEELSQDIKLLEDAL